MQVVKTKSELKNTLDAFRKEGKTIGFAPTMGALHEGHMSLTQIAKENADVVVVSIFVNPAQFAPHEDFDSYPRTVEADLEKLKAQGVDVVYLPQKEDMYPQGFDLKISTGAIGQELEGVSRPHFFDGVALVVTKLFMQVMPDVAVFGQKDFQQLHIIRKLAASLDMPIKIIGAPIIREADGLAMSSRNAYLKGEDRKIAASLNKIMLQVIEKIKAGESFEPVLQWAKDEIARAGFAKVDYLEIRDNDTLARTDKLPAQLLAAVYLGKVRLIDNMVISR